MNELSLFNTLFNDDGYGFPAFRQARVNVPCVDVTENSKCYTISMDLPGRCENDVEISLKEDVLTIASVRKTQDKDCNAENKDNKAECDSYLIRERSVSDFKRSFTMPKDINSSAVSAIFKNGVLTITIEKKPVAPVQKISINVA